MRISNIVTSSVFSVLSVAAFAACGNSKTNVSDFGASSAGGATGTGGGTAAGGNGTGASKGMAAGGASAKGGAGIIGAAGGNGPGGPGAGGGNSTCLSGPNEDNDKDGWTQAQGDCNDCDPNVNPGALDIVNKDMAGTALAADKQVDEDCNGTATQPGDDLSCDKGLPIAPGDAFDAAKAMELCNVKVDPSDAATPAKKWGVTQAVYGGITGGLFKTPLPMSSKPMELNYGIVPNFGPKTVPQGGHSIFVLSAGEARAPGQAGYDAASVCSFDKGYSDGYPSGFPKSGSCGTQGDPHDGVALDIEIRVPTNAHTMTFNFRFFTCEYPVFVCEVYNDIFAVLMNPSPLPMTDSMWPDIAFEAKGMAKNVIGVNNESFLTACTKGAAMQGNYANCKGEGDLAGSGFETHAASAWLQSQVPVNAGQKIQLRLAIWDSQDGVLDSTAAVDNFQFTADQGTGVGTVIVPNPN